MGTPSLSEAIIYSTVKINSYKSDSHTGTGTGFIFNFYGINNSAIPALVTNKHVINGADKITALLHLSENGIPSGKVIEAVIELGPSTLVNHPNQSTDLCAIPIGDILHQVIESGLQPYLSGLPSSLIPSPSEWEEFDAIEDVIMIGCPNGIHDEIKSLPIARRGITASPLRNDYNGKKEFMVDMACFPGSSGSPIFILDKNGYLDRKSGHYLFGASRLRLIGILYAGPTLSTAGTIKTQAPKSFQLSSMMHLGNAIKSSELLEIDREIMRIMEQRKSD